MMTVKELIIELLAMPMDADVVTERTYIGYEARPIHGIEFREKDNYYHKHGLVILSDDGKLGWERHE